MPEGRLPVLTPTSLAVRAGRLDGWAGASGHPGEDWRDATRITHPTGRSLVAGVGGEQG
jgi:hypothetical protein